MPDPRRPRVVAALTGAAVTAALVVAAPGASPGLAATGAAPGAPGTESDWVPGDKDGFGTARGTASKVWYTLARGKLSDVYYPRIDTPSIRDSQFVVTDGRTFTDREDRDARSRVELLSSRSLTYRLVTTARSGKWRLTKTFVTDPKRASVLQRVRFESLTGKPLRLFLLHDPALNMTGNDDTGSNGGGGALVSSDDEVASAVVTRPAMTRTSSGYAGTSDGWSDLRSDHRMDWTYTAPAPGNVVQAGRVPVNGLRGHRDRHRRAGIRPLARHCTACCPHLARLRVLEHPSCVRPRMVALPELAAPGTEERRPLHDRVERVGHGAGCQRGQDLPRRIRRRPGSPVGLGERAAGPRGLPRGVVAGPLPDRDRAAGDR